MEFEWDPEKSAKNIARHAIDFHDATALFKGEHVEHLDNRKDYGEDRWIRLAALGDTVVCAVYTKREETFRIISVRKASYYERKIYYRKIYEPN